MQVQREAIQKQIRDLNEARETFVSAKRKELAEQTGTDTLDTALIGAIREQAMKRKYTFSD